MIMAPRARNLHAHERGGRSLPAGCCSRWPAHVSLRPSRPARNRTRTQSPCAGAKTALSRPVPLLCNEALLAHALHTHPIALKAASLLTAKCAAAPYPPSLFQMTNLL
jgi:hypothetical protein